LGDRQLPLLTASQIGFNPASRYRLDVSEFLTGLTQAETVLSQDAPPGALAKLASVADLYRGEFLMPSRFRTGAGAQYRHQAFAERLLPRHVERTQLPNATTFARRRRSADTQVEYEVQLAAPIERQLLH